MRNQNAYLVEQRIIRERAPSLRYQDGEDFSTWQASAKEKLTELLGLPLENCPLDVEIEYEYDEDNPEKDNQLEKAIEVLNGM